MFYFDCLELGKREIILYEEGERYGGGCKVVFGSWIFLDY